MHRPIKDTNKYIYHYTSSEIAINHILKTKTLKANSILLTNDPKENKPWSVGLTNHISNLTNHKIKTEKARIIHQVMEYNDEQRSAIEKKKRCYFLICFSTDHIHQRSIDNNSTFNRGYGISPMWTHYANNHEGVCLIFDKFEFEKTLTILSNIKIYKNFVKYSEDIYNGNPNYIHYLDICNNSINNVIEKYLEERIDSLFFQKHPQWQYEREYRYLLKTSTGYINEFFVQFNNSLKGIVMAETIDLKDEVMITNFAFANKIRAYNMNWTNGHPTPYIKQIYSWMYDFPKID